MSLLSPADRHLQAPVQSVGGMPAMVRTGTAHPTWLVDFSPLHRWLVRGGQAAEWLAAHALEVPEAYFRTQDLGGDEDSFLVRTGNAEFFLHDGAAGNLRARVGEITGELVQGTRIVARDDLEVVLGGEGAAQLMSEFCALDLSSVANEFLLTRVAGIAAWLRVEGAGAQQVYRIGCDPSYGEYLFETLLDGARDCGGGLLGHEDFYDLRGQNHDAS
jgi:sarcosine oxidase subunit gamma